MGWGKGQAERIDRTGGGGVHWLDPGLRKHGISGLAGSRQVAENRSKLKISNLIDRVKETSPSK